MNIRLISLALLLTATTALFAEPGPTKRTIVIRDGKVVSNTTEGDPRNLPEVFRFDSELFGGKRAYLGVSLLDLTDELREHFGAPKDSGLLVSSVADDSPANKAGIRTGDIIVSVDGKDIDSSSDLRRELREKKDGDTVRLEVLRGRSRQTVIATVVEREGPQFPGMDFEGLRRFTGPEWKGRVETLGDCATLQGRIKELETRLRDLEKKLQK
jgi:predicted metalloprotease with PDZ domain